MKLILVCTIAAFSISSAHSQGAAGKSDYDQLQKLADDFWTWRAKNAPFTGDDVNRMERPGGTRDWSAAAIEKRRTISPNSNRAGNDSA